MISRFVIESCSGDISANLIQADLERNNPELDADIILYWLYGRVRARTFNALMRKLGVSETVACRVCEDSRIRLFRFGDMEADSEPPHNNVQFDLSVGERRVLP